MGLIFGNKCVNADKVCCTGRANKSQCLVKVKVKEVDLYSTFIVVPHTQGARVRITVLPAKYTVPASAS